MFSNRDTNGSRNIGSYIEQSLCFNLYALVETPPLSIDIYTLIHMLALIKCDVISQHICMHLDAFRYMMYGESRDIKRCITN